MKICRGCGEGKSIEEFNKESKSKDGRSRRCKSCKKASQKRRREKFIAGYCSSNTPEFKTCPNCKMSLPKEQYHRVRGNRDGLAVYCKECWTPRKHGLTIEAYREMIEKGCAICGKLEGKLCVDHGHACCSGPYGCPRCIRGILCDNCNRAIGLMSESPDRLRAAIAYLEKHQNGKNE